MLDNFIVSEKREVDYFLFSSLAPLWLNSDGKRIRTLTEHNTRKAPSLRATNVFVLSYAAVPGPSRIELLQLRVRR